jgi:hypothetical protein
MGILWWGFRLRPAPHQDSVSPIDESIGTIQPSVEGTGSTQSKLERDGLIGPDTPIVGDDDADTRATPKTDRLADDRPLAFEVDGAMEGQIWDFLSSHSDLKITSIPMVKCQAKDCEIHITGANPGEIVSLVRDMSGNERWTFNSVAVGVNQEVSPGLVVTVIRLSSDPKAFSETRSVAADGKI